MPLWTLHWHHLLRDGENFVAVRSPSDLLAKVKWLRRHPACARRIALAGRQLVETYLEPRLGTSCYWATLLRGLGDKLPFDARGSPDEGAIEAAEFLDRIQV